MGSKMAGAAETPSIGAAPLRAKNYANVSWVSRLFFSYVNPIVKIAALRPLEENDVEWLTPNSDEAHNLAAEFERTYQEVKAHYAPHVNGSSKTKPGRRPWTTLTGIALLRLHWWPMTLQSIWVLVEVGQRLGTPVALRQFLRWLQAYAAGDTPPQWQGWVWAVVLGACGYSMLIIHHQLFWIGMRAGFKMRQQAVSAIHSKVLRLNSAAVSALSTGHVVNLVSNDVRRLDDVMPFWIFLWAAPLELAMVLLMVSLELDFLSALAGVATSLAMIPLQSALVRYIGGLRRNTARCTDERVRLAGEVVEGALAMKMLGWEDPFASALRAIRDRETSFSRRMQRIRAINFAMQFCITPIVSFVTFAVYRARNGSLNVASVFYSLSLLHLPKLYMINFFVLAVQTLTELRVSLQRIDHFLSTSEPTRPGHQHHNHRNHHNSNHDKDLDLRGDAGRRSREAAAAAAVANGVSIATDGADKANGLLYPPGYVAMCGEDYDWLRPFGWKDVLLEATHGTALGAGKGGNLTTPSGGREGDGGAGRRRRRRRGGGGGGRHAAVGEGGKGNAQRALEQEEEEDVNGTVDTAAAASGGSDSTAVSSGSSISGLTLYGIRFSAAPGELLGICGAVGSGKSSLLAALLGELQPLQGEVDGGLAEAAAAGPGAAGSRGPILRGRVAYCSQVPWIVAGSVRENIVFGSAWDEKWYERVVHACCLADDLAGLPAGDATELGERGINLSGGQKARVSLARACYSRPEVALLDDPLSAVDPRVGRDLFARAMGPGGLLDECGSTRLLVTHQRQYLPKCDRVLVLRGGRLLAEGPWRQLVGLGLPELTAGHGGSGEAAGGGAVEEEGEEEEEAAADDEGPTVDEVLEGFAATGFPSAGSDDAADVELYANKHGDGSSSRSSPPPPQQQQRQQDVAGEVVVGLGPTKNAAGAATTTTNNNNNKLVSSPEGNAVGKLVQAEDRVTGSVSWRVYGNYCRHLGILATALIWVALFAGQAVFLASEWWLALWSKAAADEQGRTTWLWVYGMLTGIVIVLAFVRSTIYFEATLSAATSIHNAMARSVLRAPLAFFHTNPSGRIVNRFSKDQGQVDDLLPSCLFDALQSAFQVFGAFVLVAIAVPVILPVFLPLAAAFYWIRRSYITASREIKRWEAVTKSPIFASFSATLKGLPTIRAYGAANRFDDAFLKLMAHNGNWYFAFICTSRWIGVRLDAVAGTALLAAALLAMAMRDSINTGVMALALTHVLQLTGLMQWVVRQTAEVENTMTSVERMLSYTQLPSEAPRVAEGGGTPPPGWPRSGALIYQDVTAVYRPGLPPVLRGLSFSLAPGTSCGVVGRTGSGKSSLMLTLFRLIDVVHGRILLDGVDTAALGLDALRRQLAIIPQDPVLFSGTLRSNLDPWGAHRDEALWEVLQAVQLRTAVAGMPGGLDAAMAECGGNLSVGQRQLFCLARALLQDAKVLALDEATANVDRATDHLIQNALRDFARPDDGESHGRVLLIIAHRIDTILDTDHLLVLAAGQLAESGSPTELMNHRGGEGLFAQMVAAAKLAGAAKAAEAESKPATP